MLSRALNACPALVRIKFEGCTGLQGSHVLVLPECEELEVSDACDCECLEVLNAPKLKIVDLKSSVGLEHVRLWDLPAATPADADALRESAPPAVPTGTVAALKVQLRAQGLPVGGTKAS